MRWMTVTGLVCVAFLLLARPARTADDPLPSWRDGATKKAILAFVDRVTTKGTSDYVPPEERIATFDNDGTLWSEQPIYVQLAFAIDRVKALAPKHPEWKEKEPFKSILAGELKQALAGGHEAIGELIMATHAGMTTAEFEAIALDWIRTAKHPRTKRTYTQMIYQPMVELLAYLRENGFQTWIVSGGGVEFMRPWTLETYGIPPERIVGSRLAMKYEVRDGKPVLVRQAKIAHIDDGPGKPVGIQQAIGRRPILAFGNSDGDYEMIQWTTSGTGPRMGVFIHHDDAEREVAYDRDSHIGKFARGLDDAKSNGWVIVSMKKDWGRIFPAPSER